METKHTASTMPNRAEILKQRFQNSLALPFEQMLMEEVIHQILEQELRVLSRLRSTLPS